MIRAPKRKSIRDMWAGPLVWVNERKPDIFEDSVEKEFAGTARANPFDKKHRKREQRIQRAVQRWFNWMRKEVVRIFEEEATVVAEKAPTTTKQQRVFDDLASVNQKFAKMWETARKQFGAMTTDEIMGAFEEAAALAGDLGFTVDFDQIDEVVYERAANFAPEWFNALEESTSRGLTTALTTHIASGDPLPVLINKIKPLFGKARAKMIATTEVTRVYAEGNRIGYAAAGVTETEWITVSDARVDDLCRALDGKRQGIGWEDYVPPRHPNCRCWLAPIVDDDVILV